ncbi:MAG TPA: A24 family peptidase [Rhodopila sp.]|uniref:prepilin peptidase n=1 Tax=Rhodopila sp. TaxID=2480087 RepID=UPI002CA73D68|nr:A24 family peptidase [Rhodopila sp.]HVY17111.1 A24 family peptidase [Rhodopila sp.]
MHQQPRHDFCGGVNGLLALASGPHAWILAAILAPFIGSFLGVLITRLPEGRGVVFGRSRCDHCGHALAPPELIPLASFLLSGGRCRYCREPIGLLAPGVELAAVAVVGWSATAMRGADLWLSCIFGWTLLTLAWIDLRTLTLPDCLTLPLVLTGLGAMAWLNPADLPNHALAAALGYLLLFGTAWVYRVLRGRDGIGLGDAKLLAALGAWLGLESLPMVLFVGACLGLLAAIALRLSGREVSAATAIPFGPCLALSGWLLWLYPNWLVFAGVNS